MEKLGQIRNADEYGYTGLFYNPDANRFMDGDGFILNDLHELFYPWQIKVAKQAGENYGYCILESKRGEMIELFFPEGWGDMCLFWDIYRNT